MIKAGGSPESEGTIDPPLSNHAEVRNRSLLYSTSRPRQYTVTAFPLVQPKFAQPIDL